MTKTVWRREGKVYSAIPGLPEKEIGAGKGCTLEKVNSKNVYAWTENGEIVIIKPQGKKGAWHRKSAHCKST